jgi:glycosyltransferase involved in cell wall biosynthesis
MTQEITPIDLEIVIPVYNEEHSLPDCIKKLTDFLSEKSSNSWSVLIANNGSTDHTKEVAEKITNDYPRVSLLNIEEKGRGRSLKIAWGKSSARILAYMDVDLSTKLDCLPNLVSAINDENYDISIGSRLTSGANTKRSLKREVISRIYNALIRAIFLIDVSDTQCGFKAIKKSKADLLLPLIEDTGWFFDSELLIVAIKNGCKVKEIPVTWVEDTDTRVKIFKTAWEDIKGIFRLRICGIPRSTN